MTSETAPSNHVKEHIQFLLQNSPIYKHLFSDIELHSISQASSSAPSEITLSLRLRPYHLNSKGSLHGSVIATLVDFTGGLAIACYDLRSNTGVSTDMHISFISGAKEGDTLEVKGVVERCGGTLAFTRVEIRKAVVGPHGVIDMGRGDLIATGSHTKFVRTR